MNSETSNGNGTTQTMKQRTQTPEKELIIIALKGGKPVFIPRGYFGLGTEFFYEVKAAKGCKVTKRTEYKAEDFDDIAWAYLDIPSWWSRKEKEE